MAYFASFLGKQNLITMDSWHRKSKVVIIMGQTGSGKTKLSIDLATRFPAEIINSDKIQVYKGLDTVTNKVSVEEQCDVPHHLLGVVDPNEDFTALDFCRSAMLALESIVEKNLLPIIVGGSNSYIEALVDDEECEFRSNYECCFIWVDVALPLLTSFLCKRVDEMVKMGLVDEVRNIFEPDNTDYTQGIRRAIGVPEMDKYLRTEETVDEETSVILLDEAIDEIKMNTCKLASKQVDRIYRLQFLRGWNVHRIDATDVFRRDGRETDEAWERLVLEPSTLVVAQFLYSNEAEEQSMARDVVPAANATVLSNMNIGFALAAATH